MSDYDTTGPHGETTCMNCLEEISADVEGPYCSERCKHQNRSAPSKHDYLTDEQQEANGRF